MAAGRLLHATCSEANSPHVLLWPAVSPSSLLNRSATCSRTLERSTSPEASSTCDSCPQMAASSALGNARGDAASVMAAIGCTTWTACQYSPSAMYRLPSWQSTRASRQTSSTSRANCRARRRRLRQDVKSLRFEVQVGQVGVRLGTCPLRVSPAGHGTSLLCLALADPSRAERHLWQLRQHGRLLCQIEHPFKTPRSLGAVAHGKVAAPQAPKHQHLARVVLGRAVAVAKVAHPARQPRNHATTATAAALCPRHRRRPGLVGVEGVTLCEQVLADGRPDRRVATLHACKQRVHEPQVGHLAVLKHAGDAAVAHAQNLLHVVEKHLRLNDLHHLVLRAGIEAVPHPLPLLVQPPLHVPQIRRRIRPRDMPCAVDDTPQHITLGEPSVDTTTVDTTTAHTTTATHHPANPAIVC
eukprot:m.408065 g.408065  ORF g.408065 m.408065 type:complete len:413 (+) comp20142_c1_seq3:828-2066(+)